MTTKTKVPTKKATPKKSAKDLLLERIKTSKNEPLKRFNQLKESLPKGTKKEVICSIIAIERLSGAKDVPFKTYFNEFLNIIRLNRSKNTIGSNDKTRARRNLYRTIEANLVKGSKQSNDYNLSNVLKGIKISTKTPFEYKTTKDGLRGDAITSSVDNNHYTFFLSTLRPLTEEERGKELLKKINELKK